MGRKGSWISAVRKAFGTETKEKKDQSLRKSKKKWFGKSKASDPDIPSRESAAAVHERGATGEGDKILAEANNEQSKHAYTVALATAAAAEAAAAAAHAAAEVVRLTAAPRYTGKSKEEIAAIKIQTAFRGHLARRALRALRGLVRLKTLVEGPPAKRQAATALQCLQNMARVQSQIRARRIRMSEENQALQRQLQRKREKELEKMKIGEEWDDSARSKEQIEANLISKQEASMRRERALAYAYTHQHAWKSHSSKFPNPTFMDPNNPHWGWSWLERWMAARPWESRQHSSVKSTAARPPSHHQSSTTPPSKAPSLSSVTGKGKPSSSKGSVWGDDDSRCSLFSARSERYSRRHSIAGVSISGGGGGPSSVRDDDSLSSSASVPGYMAPTQSAKAKSRLASPLGTNGTLPPEKGSMGSAKKRLSFTGSPAAATMRRHSGPPKIESTSIKEIST